MFLHRGMLEWLVAWLDKLPELRCYASLFIFTYAFLLRMPSEALPVTRGGDTCGLSLEDGELVLRLARRKNRPAGSRIRRGCWCRQSASTCPVHRLRPVLESVGEGAKLFEDITPAKAIKMLRGALAALGVPRAAQYRTHDFRRGHAKDLQESGVSVPGCDCFCINLFCV